MTTIGDEEEEDHIFVSVDEEYIQEANISLKVRAGLIVLHLESF